ncbi:MAG TPA: Fur family transcriptional regulator [Vicinamibacterales bacterium]|nr:Fur family transcriptional regulator [Vicinamibacterales bacterium]
MAARSARDRYVQLRNMCVTRGLRLTPQRDVLLHALAETKGHPTADDLFKTVRRRLPTVSHATVYRNVHELVDAGLIGTLERSGAAVQFEMNPEHHHHFLCGRCGQVWDVYLDQVAVKVNTRRSPLSGFQIDRRDVQMHGVCARCRSRR